MTVSVQTPYNESVANGVTTVFPFTFKLLLPSDLRVFFNGVEQLSGFTVSGVGVNSGGNVTFTTPPANLVTVLLKRELVLKRDIDYQENGDLLANGLDNDIDRVWQAIQQFGQLLKASIKLPFTTSTEQIINDLPAVRANTLLGFDALGNVVLKLVANLVTTPVSLFMASLLNLADAIALRAAIGANPDIYTTTTTGTASAYLTAFSPTLTDFTNNPTFKITFDKTCADNATIQIAGIAPPLNLKYKTSIGTFINVSAGDILANHTTIGLLINNNTDLLIQPASASGLGGNLTRNRIINGAMQINQRAVSSVTSGLYLADRWFLATSNLFTTLSLVTDATVSLVGNNHLNLQTNTVLAAPAVGEISFVEQRIEGFNVADFRFGKADAKRINVSFRARASVAGVYTLALRNGATNRSYVVPINISTVSATYSVSIPGDTAGVWAVDNTSGLEVCLTFSANTAGTFTTPNANLWQAGNFIAHNTQSNGLDTLNRNLAVSDFQVELGSSATPFEIKQNGLEFLACQHYYQTSYLSQAAGTAGASNGRIIVLSASASSYVGFYLPFTPVLRATPTLTIYNPSTGALGGIRNETVGTDFVATGIGSPNISANYAAVQTSVAPPASHTMSLHYTANAEL